MTMHKSTRDQRRRLLAGVAAAALAMMAAPAAAQNLPSDGRVVEGTVTTTVPLGGQAGRLGGTGTGIPGNNANPRIDSDGGATSFTLQVGSPSAVIDWQGFGIAAGNTVTFTNNTAVADADKVAFTVLNRVLGNSDSNINGALRGDPNAALAVGGRQGTIWLVNENGILFGPTGSVTNMTGFVASTLGVTNAQFANFGTANAVDFVGSTNNQGDPNANGLIRIGAGNGGNAGTNIAVSGVLLMVAPRIEVQNGAALANRPTITAGGDIGFVVAQDASVRLNPTSLISVGITAGTTVGNTSLLLGGTVNGARVFATVASQQDVNDILLNVTGSITATHATATENGIVLSAGTAVDDGSFAVTMPDAGDQEQRNLAVAAGATLATTGASDIRIAGNGGLDLLGAATSGDDLLVSARSVALGGATQAAARGIVINATDGNISTNGGILRSNNGDVPFVGGALRDISLIASGNIGTAATPITLITGGAGPTRDDVTLNAGDAGTIAIGAITARNLDIIPPAGNITLGNVTLSGEFQFFGGNDLTIASLTASGTVTLQVGGDLEINGINGGSTVSLRGDNVTVTDADSLTVTNAIATAGSVSLSATGALSLTGTATATGGNLILSGSSVALGGGAAAVQQATGRTSVTATGGAITVGAGGVTLRSNSGNSTANDDRTLALTATTGIGSGGTLALSAGTTAASGRAITVTAGDGQDVTLGNVEGGSFTAALPAAPQLGTLTVGDVNARAGTITLEAETLNFGSLTASGNISLTRTGAGQFDLAGADIDAGEDLIVTGGVAGVRMDGSGTYAAGDDLTINGALEAAGALSLTATSGVATITGPITVNGSFELAAQSANLGTVTGLPGSTTINIGTTNGNLAIGNVSSVGALTLGATGGNVVMTGDAALASNAGVTVNGTISQSDTLTITGTSIDIDNVISVAGTSLGSGDVTLTATTGNVTAGTVAARNGVRVAADAAGGDVDLGGATATQGVRITAADAATVRGNVVTGNSAIYTVRAGSITVGTVGQTRTQTGAGGALLQSVTGGITGLGTVSIAATTGNAAGAGQYHGAAAGLWCAGYRRDSAGHLALGICARRRRFCRQRRAHAGHCGRAGATQHQQWQRRDQHRRRQHHQRRHHHHCRQRPDRGRRCHQYRPAERYCRQQHLA